MKVFISHAFSDAQLAQQVADTLRKEGFQVWDITQVWPGENWGESLAKALEESEAMVVLLTPNSVNSANVSHEVGYALGRQEYKGRLIPVVTASPEQIEDIEIPWVFNLQLFQTLRIPNLQENEAGLRSIARALKAVA